MRRRRNTLTRARRFRRFESNKTIVKFIESLIDSAIAFGYEKGRSTFAPPRMKISPLVQRRAFARMERIIKHFGLYLTRHGLL